MTIQPVSQPMNPLRRRMLEDMATRGLRQDTQRDYIRFVRSFAEFLRRPPDTATSEDIRRFQVHQAESGVQPQSINCSVSALRFFFTVTLDRPDLSRRFILVRYPRKLPTVLSVEEVGRLLEMAPGPKYRAALGTAYGAGLRVSEVAALKVGEIIFRQALANLIRLAVDRRAKFRVCGRHPRPVAEFDVLNQAGAPEPSVRQSPGRDSPTCALRLAPSR